VKTTKAVTAVLAGSLAFALIAGACGSSKSNTAATTAAQQTSSPAAATTAATTPPTTAAPTTTTVALKATLNSSGSSFAKIYLEEAITNFTKTNSGVTINYGAGGSGKGRQDLADQVTDFAASDSPIPAADVPKFKGGAVLYFPFVVAPITVSYNLPVDKLKLSPDTIAKIFQRQIKKWNDAAIAADNPGVTLPATDIVVAHRSDSSGTTDNFTKFLDRASGASGVWTLKSGSTVQWPTDTQAGNGNAGVAQIVQGTPGAIGYIDYADAKTLGLKLASVKNKAGKFVDPTLAAAAAAATGSTVNPDLTFSAPWADGDTSYPITFQSFILIYKKQTDKDKALATKAFIAYVLGDGQQITTALNYGPVPPALITKEIAQLGTVEMPA
jgi:phosphate transport system substrate-binding protein